MFKPTLITPSLLSFIVIVSIVLSKYLNNPGLFLLAVLLTSIFYQKDIKKKNNMNFNFEETLINLSKFIILSVGLGCIISKILGLFLLDFA
jgi:hypothetical protein